jgi:hypothetical protein
MIKPARATQPEETRYNHFDTVFIEPLSNSSWREPSKLFGQVQKRFFIIDFSLSEDQQLEGFFV